MLSDLIKLMDFFYRFADHYKAQFKLETFHNYIVKIRFRA